MNKKLSAVCFAALSLPMLAMAANVAAAVADMADTATASASAAAAPAVAVDTAAEAEAAAAAPIATVEVATRKTRSSVEMGKSDMQKILPGINPLKALQTLPGVSFQTADPWGNNEQNLSLFIHGFSGQQLGYTMDGVPLGDQQYGNYNGLSPQRAITSENVGSVILSSGAGDLSTASTSNLGGTIETFSSNPLPGQNIAVQQTVGSYKTSRTFVRYDTGNFGEGNSAYVSAVHHEQKAWDFNGRQGGDQVNAKFVNNGNNGKLTLYFAYSDKTEPNEDSTVHSATEKYQPYTRPFTYPNFQQALGYLSATGGTPAADGNNYRNYYSDAQRTDYLTYAKYDWNINDNTTWSNQIYYHNDDGVGVVAGPIGVAGLPALFAVYFPGQDLKKVFGNSGYATRTTEYAINRNGWLSTLRSEIGQHTLQAGFWLEHNRSSAYRRWYALDVNNPSSPYDRPSNPLITQYGSEIDNKVAQLHLQDEWRLRPDLTLQAGFKSSLQFADGEFPVQPKNGAIANSTALPVGEIITKKWFLPQIGGRWDITAQDQAFFNVQKNMRQFVTYGGGGVSPWSLSNQGAFDLFKATAKPETSITYEAGLRTSHQLNWGAVSAIDGQINVYHVDFKDRLLQISPTSVITSIIGGNLAVLTNVGSVKTNGVDFSGTVHFGRDFSFYNALSYNQSKYDDNYVSGKDTVLTAGKKVPGSPEWMEKFVATATVADTEFQLIGDYVGKRYATYTNDLQVSSYFLMSLGVSGKLPFLNGGWVKNARYRLNVSNLTNRAGDLNVVVGAASGTYNTFPIAPRQGFLTLMADF